MYLADWGPSSLPSTKKRKPSQQPSNRYIPGQPGCVFSLVLGGMNSGILRLCSLTPHMFLCVCVDSPCLGLILGKRPRTASLLVCVHYHAFLKPLQLLICLLLHPWTRFCSFPSTLYSFVFIKFCIYFEFFMVSFLGSSFSASSFLSLLISCGCGSMRPTSAVTFVEADLQDFHFLVNPVAGTCECLWAGAVTGEKLQSVALELEGPRLGGGVHCPRGVYSFKEAWLEIGHSVFSALS